MFSGTASKMKLNKEAEVLFVTEECFVCSRWQGKQGGTSQEQKQCTTAKITAITYCMLFYKHNISFVFLSIW